MDRLISVTRVSVSFRIQDDSALDCPWSSILSKFKFCYWHLSGKLGQVATSSSVSALPACLCPQVVDGIEILVRGVATLACVDFLCALFSRQLHPGVVQVFNRI